MDERSRKIWPVFAEEARESVQSLGDGLLALERELAAPAEQRERLRAVRRTAHSLKGSAASLGFSDVEKLAHALEDALAHAPEREKLAPEIVEAGLAAISSIEAMVETVERGGEPAIPGVQELLASLFRLGGAPRTRSLPAVVPATRPAMSELWPSFRAELSEQVAALRTKLGEGGAPAPLQELAAMLVRSAAMLEHPALGERARALEVALQNPSPERAHIERALDAVAELLVEAAPAQAPAAFAVELDALESEFLALRKASGRARTQVGKRAARRAAELAKRAQADSLPGLAQAAHNLSEVLGQVPGDASGRALAQAADLLVEARALAALPPEPAVEPAPVVEPESEPESPLGSGLDAQAASSGRLVRVAAAKIESLAGQLDQGALLQQRQAWRTAELRRLLARSWAASAWPRRMASLLRAGDQAAATRETAVMGEQLRALHRDLSQLTQELTTDVEALRIATTVTRDEVRGLRTVPASLMLEPLQRTVREVAGRLGKQVELSVEGGEVRLDRRLVEQLKDPLLHLVRNALDHGLEAPAARRKAGKPEAGRLWVSVEPRGRRVVLCVRDDGAGMDLPRIRKLARERGLVTEAELGALDDAEAMRLIFRPGFSTAAQVTEISGRGVGLDVVQAVVARLQGQVQVRHQVGQGTTFELDLPLTLSSALGVLVRSGSEVVAFLGDAVVRIVRVEHSEVSTVAGRLAVVHEGRPLPFLSLSRAMGLSEPPPSTESWTPALRVAVGTQTALIAVDEVLGEQEIVVQDLGRAMSSVRAVAGAALLGDGRIVSVANAAELLREASAAAPDRGPRGRILVADDALTTRALMRSILELAGYQVVVAPDGEAAFELLQQSRFDLVVSDVQMPRLDGLGLCRRIRADASLRELPLVLVTSLDAEDDRRAGLEVGASGYLVKREVESGKLLELLDQLLARAE